MSYTKGPYKVGDDGPGIITVETTDGRAACVLAEMENPDDEDRDNFALFAGAPEMHEALMEAHNAIDELFARLVLADATFRPSNSGRPWDALLQVNAAIEKAVPSV